MITYHEDKIAAMNFWPIKKRYWTVSNPGLRKLPISSSCPLQYSLWRKLTRSCETTAHGSPIKLHGKPICRKGHLDSPWSSIISHDWHGEEPRNQSPTMSQNQDPGVWFPNVSYSSSVAMWATKCLIYKIMDIKKKWVLFYLTNVGRVCYAAVNKHNWYF